ncbi:MAG: tryptophan-rich sensory protein, partial [Acidobacteria bacterium]|nr:tryptophan-rich sensory protein [Acidobacteriota bacterium]
ISKGNIRRVMSATFAILTSLGICVIAATLEGVAAGKNVKPFFAKLRWPSYSAPLWVWYVIGVLYYATCFFIIYRILEYDGDTVLKDISLTLILIMMAANALWNYIFFRAQNLFYSFVASIPYSLVVVALFACLIQFEKVAAWSIVPYLVYQIYALQWIYGLWRINGQVE